MKQLFFPLFALFCLGAFVWSSCEKRDYIVDDLTGTGSVEIEFDHRAGGQALDFSKNYVTANGDTVRFTEFDYYVSNFVLTKADGSEYVVPKDSCYFLVKHSVSGSNMLEINNIPAGDYTNIRFIIGVDSLKNTAPVAERTGVLDPVNGGAGMYWSWNSGYIFVKVEGTSPQAPFNAGANARIFQYHIGGFGGMNSPTINNIKKVAFDAPEPEEPAQVRKTATPHFHFYVDALEMFNAPTKVNIATNPFAHFVPFSTTLSENYKDMFKLDHIHN